MTLHDYQTGRMLREMTTEESQQYMAEIADDTTGTGAVDGGDYGYPGRSVYAV